MTLQSFRLKNIITLLSPYFNEERWRSDTDCLYGMLGRVTFLQQYNDEKLYYN